MRIVSGKHKGRPLTAPQGRDTRPTSDRAREAIFNVLEHLPDGPGIFDARVLDVFAGTGALGLEALSRGAACVVFVENNLAALKVLNANISALGEAANAKVLPIKAASLGTTDAPVDYAFLDAPYAQNLTEPALQVLVAHGWLNDGAIILVEVATSEGLSPTPGFHVVKEKTYGAARAVFLQFRL